MDKKKGCNLKLVSSGIFCHHLLSGNFRSDQTTAIDQNKIIKVAFMLCLLGAQIYLMTVPRSDSQHLG